MTIASPPLPSGQSYLLPPTDSPNSHGRSPNQSLLPLTARIGEGDRLEVGGCDVVSLVEQFGSPLYIVDEVTLRSACRHYCDGLRDAYSGEFLVLYASKAWSCLAIDAIVHQEGLGIDVVSAGELQTALDAGIPSDRIYLHGNNKSKGELALAVETGCNVVADNWADLEMLVELQPSHCVPVTIRITPGIECHTHDYIRTGHLDSKFGFDPCQIEDVFAFLVRQDSLNCIGLHAHIGSQIFELNPHGDLAGVMADWLVKARQYGLDPQELNLGGGLGIRYVEADDPPTIQSWVETIARRVEQACRDRNLPLPKLLCEPGRSLVGPSCITAYTIGSQKKIPNLRHYITVDGGMSDNPRPITYQSSYSALLANRVSAPFVRKVTVAGKHCESGDVLLQNIALPDEIHRGEVLVVAATGAYNASMASNYNRVPRPAAILVRDGEATTILRRETYRDLRRYDCLPERWISKP